MSHCRTNRGVIFDHHYFQTIIFVADFYKISKENLVRSGGLLQHFEDEHKAKIIAWKLRYPPLLPLRKKGCSENYPLFPLFFNGIKTSQKRSLKNFQLFENEIKLVFILIFCFLKTLQILNRNSFNDRFKIMFQLSSCSYILLFHKEKLLLA